MDFKAIFFNENNRLRSGLRFLIFLLSYFILSLVAVGVIGAVLMSLPVGFSEKSLGGFVVPFLIGSVVAIFLGWLYGKIFEDLPFRALGAWFTKNWLKDLFFGLIFGAFSIVLAALIGYLFGGMTFEKNQNAGFMPLALTLGSTLLIFTFGAIAEEVLFRGYMLQTLSRAKIFRVGMILTSFLFASAHNANPGANVFTWINTFLAGIWLAIAYYKTRNLWFPFGVHFAWNWVQGAFLGINVSGLSELASAPLLRVTGTGNSFVSGGDYGVEGGISCTIALIVSTVLIYFSPFLKPTAEMLALTSEEIPKKEISA
ncbi:MAG: CPBP family intramembrane metalloprotease [Pyrinomonadaceae bacterium]|nr:CPBP family intramembrane metalloprotease [Pyrinomonadaceae bacterium]